MSGLFLVAGVIGLPMSGFFLMVSSHRASYTLKGIALFYLALSLLGLGSMVLENQELIQSEFTVRDAIEWLDE